MPPKRRPDEGGQGPPIHFEHAWTANECAHYLMAVAALQAHRTQAGLPLLPTDHPMVRLEFMLIETVLPMIATGVANGWDVSALIVYQNMLNEAMEEKRGEA